MTRFRALLGTLALLLTLVVSPILGQTAMTTTTLAAAVNDSATQITVASATSAVPGSYVLIDREVMRIVSAASTVLTVQRGFDRSATRAHAISSPVFIGTPDQFAGNAAPSGACTRATAGVLPRIVLPQADIYDCPVGANASWVLLNGEGLRTARSEAFNLDNGSGSTIDAVLLRSPRDILVTACRIVYEDATTGTVAGGNARVGTTVGGSEIVASTAYVNSATVGAATAMTIVNGNVGAGVPVLVRHTGVATTNAGEAVVECDYVYR